MNLRQCDLTWINTCTKYPSIPTYHPMVEGRLRETVPLMWPEALVTEKVDGTNVRVLQDGYGNFILGSREALLTFSGDVLFDPSMGIVASLRDVVATWEYPRKGTLRAVYGELYGHGIGAAGKGYALGQDRGFRLFDVAEHTIFDGLPRELAALSAWRENGNVPFVGEERLAEVAASLQQELTPRLATVDLELQTMSDALEWLQGFKTSQSGLSGLTPEAEGVVVRSRDRSRIAKLRFEDYRKALRNGR